MIIIHRNLLKSWSNRLIIYVSFVRTLILMTLIHCLLLPKRLQDKERLVKIERVLMRLNYHHTYVEFNEKMYDLRVPAKRIACIDCLSDISTPKNSQYIEENYQRNMMIIL